MGHMKGPWKKMGHMKVPWKKNGHMKVQLIRRRNIYTPQGKKYMSHKAKEAKMSKPKWWSGVCFKSFSEPSFDLINKTCRSKFPHQNQKSENRKERLRMQQKGVLFKIIQKFPDHRLSSWDPVVRCIPLINIPRPRDRHQKDHRYGNGTWNDSCVRSGMINFQKKPI